MPAARYSQFWPRMPAFALPAFYDGRIRFNVAGREAQGIVPLRDYEMACNQMIESLNQCRNLLNGKKAIAEIHWPKQDANSVGASEADLYVEWESAPLGLAHPRLGSIGPIPYRRTGGHTGAGGFLFINGSGGTSGDHGAGEFFRRCSYDPGFAWRTSTFGHQRHFLGACNIRERKNRQVNVGSPLSNANAEFDGRGWVDSNET